MRRRYDCPGERLIQLQYHTAPPLPPAEASWKPRLMLLLGVVGPLTYMALVLALGIFKRAPAEAQGLAVDPRPHICKPPLLHQLQKAGWQLHLVLLRRSHSCWAPACTAHPRRLPGLHGSEGDAVCHQQLHTWNVLDPVPGRCRKQKVLPGDLSEAQEFAQSKGQAQKQGRTGVRFADVAGCDPILAELKDVVEVPPEAFRAPVPAVLAPRSWLSPGIHTRPGASPALAGWRLRSWAELGRGPCAVLWHSWVQAAPAACIQASALHGLPWLPQGAKHCQA